MGKRQGYIMTKDDEKEFLKLMVILNEVFGKKEISKQLVEIYFQTLKEFNIDVISLAFSKVIKEFNYDCLPKPSELRRHIIGKPEDKAFLAWDKFLKAFQQYGYYHSVQFDDPVIHSVVRSLGGWIEIAQWLDKDLQWNEKRFIELYNSLQNKQEHPQYLGGTFEAENGKDKTEIKFIGDKNVLGEQKKQLTAKQIFEKIIKRD